jgi:CRISPR type III-B/RAMP module RAMP protein Cmr1
VNCIKLVLEVVTPAFVAGADQRDVELRAASIKGLLRWWWRASEGHRFRDLDDLVQEEGRFFGSAALKMRSLLLVTAEREAPESSATYEYRRRDKDGRETKAQALHYLGYGPIRIASKEERAAAEAGRDPALLGPDRRPKRGAVYIRPALAPGTRLTVNLSWRHGTLSDDQRNQLARALGGWVALGGVGCRSRKGMGSLDLVEVMGNAVREPHGFSEVLQEAIAEYRTDGAPLPQQLPKWPQVRFRQVLHQTDPKTSWEEALGALALEYRKLRPRVRDRERRFICGEVNPRRASSVLLSVHREEQGFFGLMVALPCWKDASSEARPAWDSFLLERGRGRPCGGRPAGRVGGEGTHLSARGPKCDGGG